MILLLSISYKAFLPIATRLKRVIYGYEADIMPITIYNPFSVYCTRIDRSGIIGV